MAKPNLAAMQFSFIADSDAINTTSSSTYTITYQFATTSQPNDLPTTSNYSGWTAMTAAEKAAIEQVFDILETFLNVEFVEVTGSSDPDLNLGKVDLASGTSGYGGLSVSYFGTAISNWDGYAVFDNDLDLSDSDQFNLLLHEIGHALGLKHPFDGDSALSDAYDSNKYTVMSYDDNPDTGGLSDTYMLYDVYALQDIWGSASYNKGATTYTGPRTDTVDVIWDTGGKDTFDASSYSNDVTLDLRGGQFSQFGDYEDVVIAYGTKIENATGGSGDDTIIGNLLDNILIGGEGRDILRGRNGDDTIQGGTQGDRLSGNLGNDTLSGQGGRDKLNGGQGDDLLYGGAGKDKFVFGLGYDNDQILDFQDGLDRIKFNDLGTVEDVLGHATQDGDNVVFDFGDGDSLTVWNTTIAAVSDDIFV